MLTETPMIVDVAEFVLRIEYNRPKKEKTLGESRYIMMTSKMKKKYGKITYPSSKNLPPDEASMKMKILRGTYVSIIMFSCLNPTFVPPDPSLYGWKSVDGSWELVWFEGKQYPDPTEQDKREVEGVKPGDGNEDNEEDDDDSDDSDSDCPESGSDNDGNSDGDSD